MTLTDAEIAGMRATVLDVQLDMRCLIERDLGTGEDPYGQPQSDWGVHMDNVPCHYWQEAENELVGTPNATVTRERLVLPDNTDVTTKDRVKWVEGVDDTLIAGQLDIIEVIQAINQVLLVVKAVE